MSFTFPENIRMPNLSHLFVEKSELIQWLLLSKGVTRMQLLVASKRLKILHKRRIGELLVELGMISIPGLKVGLQHHFLANQALEEGEPKKKLGEVLVEDGFISKEDLRHVLSVQFRLRQLTLEDILTDMGMLTESDYSELICQKFPFMSWKGAVSKLSGLHLATVQT